MQPDSTERNALGLTPQQEQAAALLLTGLSVGEVAERLDIHRTTLWHWRNLETFQAHLNALRSEAKEQAAEATFALHAKAVATMERLLDSGGDAVAFRAAAFVLGAVQTRYVGQTDARALIRDRQAAQSSDEFTRLLASVGNDSQAYERRCRELGIEP